MKKISKIIYCDGSSLGNPGRAGYGVVALDLDKNIFYEFGGGENVATNNQMELAACIFSLELILKSNTNDSNNNLFEIRLDSKYVLQGATEWVKNWIKNNWRTAAKKEVLNKDEWKRIVNLLTEIEARNIKIVWTHVYGHTGERWNERVDEIAKSFATNKDLANKILRKGAIE